MIELIIDAVKLVFSEDARKSAAGLVEFIRRSPDWQKDICTLEAKVDVDSGEHAYLLGGSTAEKMKNLKYAAKSVSAFEYTYRELTANAFEHGCKSNRSDRISIRLETTSLYVSLTIRNPRGCEFDLDEQMKLQRSQFRDNADSVRGRGFLQSFSLDCANGFSAGFARIHNLAAFLLCRNLQTVYSLRLRSAIFEGRNEFSILIKPWRTWDFLEIQSRHIRCW